MTQFNMAKIMELPVIQKEKSKKNDKDTMRRRKNQECLLLEI